MIEKILLRFLGFLISCFYPALLTYKAIGNGSRNEQKVWMKYWIVFGSFALFDYFATALLSWIPFFDVLKLAFLFWLLPGVGDGSQQLYEFYLEPLFIEYEQTIEETIGQTFNLQFGFLQRIKRWLIENLPEESQQEISSVETMENATGTMENATGIMENATGTIEKQNETIKCENLTEAEKLKRAKLLKSASPKPPMRPKSLKNTPKLTDISVNPFVEAEQRNGTA